MLFFSWNCLFNSFPTYSSNIFVVCAVWWDKLMQLRLMQIQLRKIVVLSGYVRGRKSLCARFSITWLVGRKLQFLWHLKCIKEIIAIFWRLSLNKEKIECLKGPKSIGILLSLILCWIIVDNFILLINFLEVQETW